jgi:hypothetical protein
MAKDGGLEMNEKTNKGYQVQGQTQAFILLVIF